MIERQRLFLVKRMNVSSKRENGLSKGKKIEEALRIKNTDIASYLNLPPVKLHCSMLAEDAIKAAVGDYKVKNTSERGSLH